MPDPFEPAATPDTRPYWDGASEGRLRIQRCLDCTRFYFYPRRFCRYCASSNVEWVDASGRARLHSYVINQRPFPGAEDFSPVIAVVRLEEGPTMMTNIIDVDPQPDNLPLDLPLRVSFERRGRASVPVFKPDEAAR